MDAQARKQKKQLREVKKRHLMGVSEKRAESQSAPNYGIKEGDLLALQQTVKALVSANNNHHKIIKDYETDVKEKLMHGYYMGQVILKILLDKGIVTEEEIDRLTKEVQTNQNGLSSKGADAVGEKGDLLLISFIIYDGKGDVVEDRTKEVLAYNLGSGDLPCDEQLIGIRKGEIRHLTVNFGQGFKFKDHIGQDLVMHLTCHDIQVKSRSD
jgi:hypothetical protein